MDSAIPKHEMVEQVLRVVGQSNPGVDPEVVQASLKLLGFASTIVSSVESHFERYGLSQGRFAVLMMLYHLNKESWTPAKLAQQVGATRATLTGLLDGLEADKWIERKANPEDGRSTLVVLTRSGRNRMKKILPDHWRRMLPVVSQLTNAERKTMLNVVAKLTPFYERLKEK